MDLNLVAVFARVAELRSFTAAAQSLHIPKSTVSRTVKRLEGEVGAPLFLRSTRIVILTPLGERLFASCHAELAALSDRLRSALTDTQQPARLIRMTAVDDMGAHLLPAVIAVFSRRYPLLRFELLLSNEQLNLIRDGIDLAIRVGKLPQISYRKRHLGTVSFALVASSRYAERHPSITLADLPSHPLFTLPGYAQRRRALHLVNEDDEVRLTPNVKAAATNTAAILELVRQDLGVGLVPEFLARDSFVRICPGWHTPVQRVSLLYTAKPPLESVIKELGDCIHEQFQRLFMGNRGRT